MVDVVVSRKRGEWVVMEAVVALQIDASDDRLLYCVCHAAASSFGGLVTL